MIRLDLKISWLEFMVMTLCHSMALASLLYIAVSPLLSLLFGLVILSSLVRQSLRILQLSGSSVLGAYIGNTSSRLNCRDGEKAVVLQGAVYRSQMFTLLEFKVSGKEVNVLDKLFKRSKILLPLPVDSLSVTQFKNLHGYLNHSFIQPDN